MSVTTNVNQIKLNIMTKAQYNAATKSASELYMVTDAEDSTIQVDTLPTASVDVLGKIYQYVGATTASCTNGYFYKCVSDGAVTPTYSWQQVEVQPAGSSSLPDQTGQSGKFLTTDGTDASWAAVDALPSQSGQNGKVLTTNGTKASWGLTGATIRVWGANE